MDPSSTWMDRALGTSKFIRVKIWGSKFQEALVRLSRFNMIVGSEQVKNGSECRGINSWPFPLSYMLF